MVGDQVELGRCRVSRSTEHPSCSLKEISSRDDCGFEFRFALLIFVEQVKVLFPDYRYPRHDRQVSLSHSPPVFGGVPC